MGLRTDYFLQQLFLFCFPSDASKHENVDRLGSMRLPLVRLLGNSNGRVSDKTRQPWGGRTCGGARQVLFCTETLHQPHNKAEVSSLYIIIYSTKELDRNVHKFFFKLFLSLVSKHFSKHLFLSFCYRLKLIYISADLVV